MFAAFTILLQLNIHPIQTNVRSSITANFNCMSHRWIANIQQDKNWVKKKKKSYVEVYARIALTEISSIVNYILFFCFILRCQYVYRFYSLHEEFEEFII